MAGPVGRNLGLVIALVLLCIVGVITAGDRFANIDNVLTILRLAVGHRRGQRRHDLRDHRRRHRPVGRRARRRSSSVWATTLATQQLAEDFHWIVMVVTALLVGAGARAGQRRGHRLRQARRRSSPRWRCSPRARGLAEIISNRRTQIVQDQRLPRLLLRRRARHPDAGDHLRAGRRRRLGAAQPDHVRPAHLRRRRQRRGRPAGRHPGPAAHRASSTCCPASAAASPR